MSGARPAALADVLRNDVVPLYYDRDRDGVPREWIARMKRGMRTLGWRFSAHRMVMDYVTKAYIPAAGARAAARSAGSSRAASRPNVATQRRDPT